MISKPLSADDPYGLLTEPEDLPEDIEIEGADPAPTEVIEHEDGSATIEFGEEEEAEAELPADHDANLAETLDDERLREVADQVMEWFQSDIDGRREWEDAYVEGLDYLGVKTEDRSKPWPGASGVYHPLLMEAVVRFQSQAMSEIYPPAGPAKTRILGKETPEKRQRAVRIQDELNYQLTQKMPDYRPETERLLFRLALVGSCFRKVYFDPIRQRPSAKFVPAEDFVVPYGESDLCTAERFAHICRYSANEMKRMQVGGYYRELEHDVEPVAEQGEVQDKAAELTGVQPKSPGTDKVEVVEMHADFDLGEDADGLALPYVVCVDRDSNQILSIRRNWREEDPTKQRRSWFVAYEYVPGLGFYGFGLIHLIGSLTKSVTSIMRQLIDAGTLANLPGGLKARGLRIKGDDTPIRPGEFRDVDVASGKIAEAITFLPHKEPSGVLHQLLQQLVEEGRRVGSIADVDVGDMSGEAPVGTTLALLERAQKVMSAVQARLHASLAKELKLIAEIVRDYMPPEYDYDLGEQQEQFDRAKDFASAGVEVIPVSDPGATTMSQRVVQHQAAVQMASQAPQLYDMPKLHRVGLEILGIKDADEILPLPKEQKPRDPVTENMAILKGEPVKAFISQDHQAHIAVHMAAMQDPKLQQLVGQSPNAQLIMSAMQAHITEHLAFAYRQQMEQQLGQQLPAPDEDLPEDVEAELARALAPAAQQLLQKNQTEAAQQQAQAMIEDPLVQLQARELALKEADMQRKMETDFAKMQSESQKAVLKNLVELARIASNEETEGARIGSKMANDSARLQHDAEQAARQLAQSTRQRGGRE